MSSHVLWSDMLKRVMSIGMDSVRAAQMAGPVREVEVKSADRSLVTKDDRKTERAIREAVLDLGYPVHGEELGAAGNANDRYLVIIDPIDGTRPFANRHMGGSTVILTVYDKFERRNVVSAIGCPGTREVWLAENGVTHRYHWSNEGYRYAHRCQVWEDDGSVSWPTVYVDNPNPFKRRGGVDMLRAENLDVLDAEIRRAGFTKFAVGSNGLHHALVATGGPVVGAITTSIGGIQDLGGIAVVEGAGGKVATFSLTDDRKLVERDPHADLLMEGGYDFLVAAIDAGYLERLTHLLWQSIATAG